MKWAEEKPGFSTSVHSWKPCTPERFARLVHGYTTVCGSEWGHGGLTMTACKLDHEATATIYYRPKDITNPEGAVRTPCLMTVRGVDNRVITFERIPSRDYPGLPEVVDQA